MTALWDLVGSASTDRGAAICAAPVFTAGIVVTSVRGARHPAGRMKE